tara:strand:- start:414 stop:596 length:183 start_codon:yes stop_codon:yes gene_type:complete
MTQVTENQGVKKEIKSIEKVIIIVDALEKLGYNTDKLSIETTFYISRTIDTIMETAIPTK